MVKEKSIKIIYLAVVLISIILLFVGCFSSKNAYASQKVPNKVYTIEEIYNMYNIPEEDRIYPDEYEYERLLIVSDTSEYRLVLIFYNIPLDLSKLNIVGNKVYYPFEETVLCIEYNYDKQRINYIEEYNQPNLWIGADPIYETTYNEDFLGRRIIYSSHDIYKPDSTIFFSAHKIRTRMTTIMRELSPEMGKVMKEVVLLIPIGVGLVISFLGFRKAYQMLSRILRRS